MKYCTVDKSFKVLHPQTEARESVSLAQVPVEVREPTEIVKEFLTLSKCLSGRWDLYCQYQEWLQDGCSGEEPLFFDDNRRIMRSARYALAPCALINTTLGSAVRLSLKEYSPNQLDELLPMIRATKEFQMLRRVATHAEESMEQEALSLLFRILNDYPADCRDMIEEITNSKGVNPTRTNLLEVLVVDLPGTVKQSSLSKYPELPFPYFTNYRELVEAELHLLKVPFLLQNSKAPYSYTSVEKLLEYNPMFNILLQQENECAEASQIITNYPEIFGFKNLNNVTFTFVGAGFPLTGIILHIKTGCFVNLIDCDITAVTSAKRFILLTNELGITKPGYITVVHANATDVIYLPKGKLPNSLKYYDGPSSHSCCARHPEMPNKRIVHTDVLDLASALPASVTAKILKDNASLVPLVRKRNVRGLSQLWYEKFTLPEDNTFKLVGEVTPPQHVISGCSPSELVVGLTSPININSCQLYVNTYNFETKYAFLENLCEKFSLQLNIEQDNLIDTRVKLFYKTKVDQN